MATTYDKASLVMIPSGVKESKLYSIKPTDGSGDFTFSRGADTATRVNASGLIEKETMNIAIYSEDATNAVYSKSNISVTANNATSPIGTATADTITATANGATLQGVVTAISGIAYTMSVYIKRRTGTGQVGLRGINNVVTNITITNDWQRYEVFMVSNSTIGRYGVYLATSGDEVDVWGFQLNQGLVAQDYLKTTTSAVYGGVTDNLPRLDYSGGASCPSLKLEPQRTNVFTDSEYFNGSDWLLQDATITDNAAISPEGVQNASLYTTSSVLYDFVRQNIAFVSGTTYTYSVFAKQGTSSLIALGFSSAAFAANQAATFDLSDGTYTLAEPNVIVSMDDFGNGWWRCSITATATASATRSTGFSSASTDAVSNLYIYGAQMEVGSYPTSYIPTYGSSQTRVKDDCEDTSATDLIGQTEGTLFLDIDYVVGQNTNYGIIYNVGFSSYIYINQQVAGSIYGQIQTAGIQFISAKTSGRYKCALAYKSGDSAFFINGEQVGTTSSTTFTLNTMTNFEIGRDGNHTSKQAILFPTRLTNAECIALTTI